MELYGYKQLYKSQNEICVHACIKKLQLIIDTHSYLYHTYINICRLIMHNYITAYYDCELYL